MQHTNTQSKLEARPTVLHGLIFAINTILVLAGAPTAAAAAEPELMLSGDFTDSAELYIGSNLDVQVSNGEPLRRYTVLLVDENDEPVVTLADIGTGNTGATARHRLWTRTGVEGCDPEAVHDPSNYQFISFSEAESELDGLKFRVLLVESPDSGPEKAIAEHELPLTTASPFVSGYPSDAAGCLRTEFKFNEKVYLAIRHSAGAPQDFRIFVVAPQSVWMTNDPLVDVRTGGSQLIQVPPGAGPNVELLWASPAAGDYQIIVRPGDQTVGGFQATDVAIETTFKPAGSTYPECTVCPPPTDG